VIPDIDVQVDKKINLIKIKDIAGLIAQI